MTKWLRTKQKAERYTCTPRTIQRMHDDGRLPPPEYPFGNSIPANSEEQLDAHDAAMAAAGRAKHAALAKKPEAAAEANSGSET